MDEWYFMFEAVQKIVQAAANPDEGLQQLLTFAAQHPDRYDDADFWKAVAGTKMPFDTLKSWAKEGLEKLSDASGWSLIILDCGDCPDVFVMNAPYFKIEDDFNRFLEIARTRTIVDDFERLPPLYPVEDITLVFHNICQELNHPILSWYDNDDDWHGDSGYLLWLTVATLALSDVLRDVGYCRSILRGRQTILVLSGFEEIFFCVGTISEAGFQP